MKKNQTVELLAQQAWDEGVAKKGMYAVERANDTLVLSLRKKTLAQFRVTGYQQGVIEHSQASTEAQKIAVDTFLNYFQGTHA